jgi:hypothetical protein
MRLPCHSHRQFPFGSSREARLLPVGETEPEYEIQKEVETGKTFETPEPKEQKEPETEAEAHEREELKRAERDLANEKTREERFEGEMRRFGATLEEERAKEQQVIVEGAQEEKVQQKEVPEAASKNDTGESALEALLDDVEEREERPTGGEDELQEVEDMADEDLTFLNKELTTLGLGPLEEVGARPEHREEQLKPLPKPKEEKKEKKEEREAAPLPEDREKMEGVVGEAQSPDEQVVGGTETLRENVGKVEQAEEKAKEESEGFTELEQADRAKQPGKEY